MFRIVKDHNNNDTYINPQHVCAVTRASSDMCDLHLVDGRIISSPWPQKKIVAVLEGYVYEEEEDIKDAAVKNDLNFFQLVPDLVGRLLKNPEIAMHAAAIAFKGNNNLRDSSIKFWFPISQKRLAFITLIENASHTWGLDIYLGTMDDASECALRHNIGGRNNKPLTCCVPDAEAICNALVEVAARM